MHRVAFELVGPEQHHVGIARLRTADRTFEQARVVEVVRIEEEQIGAGRPLHAVVARRSGMGVATVGHNRYARVAGGVAGKDSRRLVGRRVVDDDELEIAHRLAQDAIQARTHPCGPVVHGHDYRHKRHTASTHHAPQRTFIAMPDALSLPHRTLMSDAQKTNRVCLAIAIVQDIVAGSIHHEAAGAECSARGRFDERRSIPQIAQ